MQEMSHLLLASFATQTDTYANESGMRGLMLAVLEDAIRQFGASPIGRNHIEAERWIMSPERHYVFSFAVICETLGLAPSAVRRSLIRLLARKPAGRPLLERARCNVRHTAPIRLQRTHSPNIVAFIAGAHSSGGGG